MKNQELLKLIMVLTLIMIGCDRAATNPDPPTKPDRAIKSYPLRGVVKRLDLATGEITIAHEDIVGFMPKMTMPFLVKEKATLEAIQVGDKVEGVLRVEFEGADVQKFDLGDLKVVGHESRPPEEIATTVISTPETLKTGELVPDFAMTTQDGKTLKLADLRGKIVVLSFIYTRCPLPEFCPAMDTKFAELARRIGANSERADQVRLLSVSFDPEHDTPEVLRAHAERRGAKPPLWTFAVASHQELSKVAEPLGLTYVPETREISHNLRAAVIGPDGRLVLVESGPGWQPAEMLKTILGLVPVRQK